MDTKIHYDTLRGKSEAVALHCTYYTAEGTVSEK